MNGRNKQCGRKAGYKHTPEEKEKLRIARQKYLEKNGTLLGISEKDNKTEYMRLYQRQWRAKNPDYYRSRYKKKNLTVKEEMTRLNEIQTAYNMFIARGIEYEYRTSAYNEDELKKLADDVTNKIANYLAEMKQENEEKENANK